ncbi:hypothetical protein Tco_1382811, partial [Tanacetum coccineum]
MESRGGRGERIVAGCGVLEGVSGDKGYVCMRGEESSTTDLVSTERWKVETNCSGDGGDMVVMGTGWQWRVDGCGVDVVEIKVTRWWWRWDDDGVGDGSSGGCHDGVAAGWREVAKRWPE